MFHGIFCPSITPLTSSGDIDYPAWEKHLNYLVDAGVDGILVLGSIGEFYAFTVEEKREIIAFASRVIDGRAKFLAGTGGTRQADTIELNEYCGQHGVDAAVVVSPYYFGPSRQLAPKYFAQLAEASPVPIILYNFPDRTGMDLDAELVAEIAAATSNVVGVKDTIDSIAHNRHTIASAPEGFAVLSGFDEYYLSNRVAGGAGVLSGLVNVVPETFVAMHRAYEAGEWETALAHAAKISALMAVYDIGDQFIQTIKAAALLRRGEDTSFRTREPAIDLSPAELDEIRDLLAAHDA